MKEVFFLVEESIEGGYTAKALRESIYTEANSIEELKNEIKDAVLCQLMKMICPNSLHYKNLKLIARI